MTLHLIQKSPFQTSVLTDCLNIIAEDDSILFMQDGIYSLQHAALNGIKNTAYALQDDLTARGILNCRPSCQAISYQEFVAICSQHEHTISWF